MLLKLIPHHTSAIGNYTFHLCYSILLALKNKYKIVIPINKALKFFNTDEIIYDFRKNNCNDNKEIISDKYFIHGTKELRDENSFYKRYQCIRKYINPIIDKDRTNYLKTDKDTLVIHMRSGDIFKPGGVNKKYAQPSLTYYCKIIDDNNYKKIIVMTQDFQGNPKRLDLSNPVVKELMKLYPDIKLQKNNPLEYDFYTLLNCKNMVMSRSTFSVILSILNPNLINLYIPIFNTYPDYNFGNNIYAQTDKYTFNIIKHKIHYEDKMRIWKNTKEQNNLMLDAKVKITLFN